MVPTVALYWMLWLSQLVDDLSVYPRCGTSRRRGKKISDRVAHAIRGLALADPNMFPLIATTPAQFPWIRPPLRGIRWVGHNLALLTQYGFADRDAVGAYKAFTSFLPGYLMPKAAPRAPIWHPSRWSSALPHRGQHIVSSAGFPPPSNSCIRYSHRTTRTANATTPSTNSRTAPLIDHLTPVTG